MKTPRLESALLGTHSTPGIQAIHCLYCPNWKRVLLQARLPTNFWVELNSFNHGAPGWRKRYDEIYQDRLFKLTEAIQKNPQNANTKVELAKFLTDESDISRRGEAVEPRRAHMPYREKPDEKGELERAVQVCNDALQLDPKHVRALMQKAFALSRLDRDGDAEPLVDQALAIAPKDPEALKLRAQYWTRRANNLMLQAAALRTSRSSSNSPHREPLRRRVRGHRNHLLSADQADLAQADSLEQAAAQLFQQANVAITAALDATRVRSRGCCSKRKSSFRVSKPTPPRRP